MRIAELEGRLAHTALGPVAAAAVTACGCAIIYAADPTTPGGILPVCPTKALFGINCPGCGSLRAIYSLMHFDFASAVDYNALALVGIVLVAWSFLAWIAGMAGKSIPRWERVRGAPYMVGIALLGWFIIRLLPFEPFVNLQV
ncbi:DUF2752 domain-containing protein [Corynebacterium sp. SCR221107]|uniref:DUF2752 domain-containing protein n=1 Tax=Corynebacterium sp. SCR221107 TaxID=3017361 RepID=UPI0022EC63DA|nr:DUF2752 domain-containing protein [Corynebacterium sp. SCR221107]WBT09140.1 DUF2752 domain-containing protein [Corynebacterium sp. SCR221107]